ncbi:MAG: hypothetical protein RSC97_10240 [Eubacterium sp.]
MPDNVRYLKLTDYENRGTVIKQEGRRSFGYENGEWVRRGLGIGYFYPDAPEFDCYEVITEEDAIKLVIKE